MLGVIGVIAWVMLSWSWARPGRKSQYTAFATMLVSLVVSLLDAKKAAIRVANEA